MHYSGVCVEFWRCYCRGVVDLVCRFVDLCVLNFYAFRHVACHHGIARIRFEDGVYSRGAYAPRDL